MHDWTLKSIWIEWKLARVTVFLENLKAQDVKLIAEGVVDLHVPQQMEWGPSVSVNKLNGPSGSEDGARTIAIEMQSGDVITITARAFDVPVL